MLAGFYPVERFPHNPTTMKFLYSKAYGKKHRRAIYGLLLVMSLLMAGVSPALALSPDFYTAESRLASGRWVKIAVSQSGMHLLTEQQLRQWGFSDPARVKVYGYGAMRLPDRLDSSYIDDLPQTPSEYISGRGIVFFGEGPVTIGNAATTYLRPVQSPFTTQGYYFLSDNDDERLVPATDTVSSPSASEPADTYQELAYHEEELYSPGYAGYLMVGEDFKYTNSRTFKIDLPGIDTSRSVTMEASFVAKTLSEDSNITYFLNGTALPYGSGDRIKFTNDAEKHGEEGLSRKEFNVTSESVQIGVTFSCPSTVTSANLNYIALTYTRRLTLDDGNKIFHASRGSSGFSISGADSETRVWDITTPLSATKMDISPAASGVSVWSLQRSGVRRFAAWKPSAPFLSATLVGEVRNQNLHALPAAEMVIFTVPAWKDQAERLANFHRNDEVDPLDVVVLTPQEIYNEFSSGVPDVQSFRKLLKMMYDRQAGTDKPLRYALFLSRPVCDIRQVTDYGKSLGNTFLPAWFSNTGLYDNDAYTTDDIFGFLDDNSGTTTSSDKLRIAVGRIPAITQSDVKTAVDKLERYYTKMPRTNWKNNILVSADDEDAGIHMTHAEWFCDYLSKSNGGEDGFIKKLYIDAYERTSNICEEARQVFYRYLDEGALLWFYTGHANASSLTGENLVTYSDLNSMYLRHWPVVYGATCNFLRWDSPTVSGAEILFKNPNGGVIAGISATRAVYISYNGNLSASLGRHFLERDEDGKYMTLGEIYMRAKNDYMDETHRDSQGNRDPIPRPDSNKLRYVLMGDPALRLMMPSSRVILDRIHETDMPVAPDQELPCLMARQQTTITGHIENPDGTPASGFNGHLVATIYDAEQSVTTQGYGKGEKMTFDQQGGRLMVGNTDIKDGRFTLPVNMPSEVVNNYRNAAISLYAYEDNGEEAIGVNRDFYVYGTDFDSEPDVVPPTIDAFYLNHPSFVSGDEVNNSPMVIAEISDDRAINLSTAGVGHQMGLYLDNGSKTYTDVSDYFTPYTNGVAGGTIAYPLEGLAVGAHTLRLRVWDTAPNSAEATLDFFVAKEIVPTIYEVYTDCNPASVEANFYVSHDRPDRELTVTIEVFDMMGRRLWQATQQGRSDMFQSQPITWDLTDYGGHRVNRGIYLYRATISDDYSGEKTATASRRLAVTAN